MLSDYAAHSSCSGDGFCALRDGGDYRSTCKEGTVDVDITGDMNDRSVSVNGSGLHVVSMDYSQLAAGTNPIYFEFPDYGDDTVL